jgi:hypothetical protein
MSVAALFSDIEKARDITRHISKLKFSISTLKIISSFLSQGKFKGLFEGIISMPWEIRAGVPQGSILSLILHILYSNNAPRTPSAHLVLFDNDTCIYATESKEGYVFRELQCGIL